MLQGTTKGVQHQPTELNKLLVSRREAAWFLSVSQRALDYLIADGRLLSRRIGGRVMVPYKALQAFADSDQTQEIVSKAA